MDGFKTLPKRAATSKELLENSPNALKVPEVLSRYSTRLPPHSVSPETIQSVPIYSPAPKPSQLLLDYINTPSSKSKLRRNGSPMLEKYLTLTSPLNSHSSRLISSKSLKTYKSEQFKPGPPSPNYLKVPKDLP